MRRYVPLLLLLGAAAAGTVLPQQNPKWMARFRQKQAALAADKPALVFFGDTNVAELETRTPRFGDLNSVWQRFYACRDAVNLGFANDTTGNMRWRLQQGELAGQRPKLVVLIAGGDDISPAGGALPETAARNIWTLAEDLHAVVPQSRILVLGILPREKFDFRRIKTNRILRGEDWPRLGARFLDLGDRFAPGGQIDAGLYRQVANGRPLLHPNASGWTVIAEAMEPFVARALGEAPCGATRGRPTQ